MRAFVRVLGRICLAVGWVLFFALGALFVAEQSGLLTRIVRNWMVDRSGLPASELDVGHVALRWFRAGVELEGLRLGRAGDLLTLDRASFEFAPFASGGPRLRRVDSEGGHLRLSPELFDRLGELAEKLPPLEPGARRTADIPAITVRGLRVDLETKRFGRLPLGAVDVAVREVENGAPVLSGRLVPSLSSPPAGSGEIVLAGEESRPGTFDVTASASGVPISTEYLPAGTELETLRALAPRATLGLIASGEISFDGRTAPFGKTRIELSDASLLVGDRQPIDRVHVEVDARYEPESVEDLWNLSSWFVSVRTAGRWKEVPFDSVVRVGKASDPANLFSVDLHVPTFQASHDLLALFGDRPADESVWAALDPRGSVELWAGLDCSRDWLPGEPIGPKLGVACEVGMDGKAGITYHGFPSRASGRRDQGFPLAVDGIQGSVLYAFDPRRHRPVKIGIAGIEAHAPHGTLKGRGLVSSPPIDAPRNAPGQGYVEVDLDIRAEHLPVDETLRSALHGLADAVPPAGTWQPFEPSGGELGGSIRLLRTVDMPYAAVDLALDLEDVAVAWKELPVPVAKMRGKLGFVSDGRSQSGLGGRFRGSLRTAGGLDLALRYQSDPSVPASDGSPVRIDRIVLLSVAVDHASLTGGDKKILVTQIPSIGAAMDTAAPKGFADVVYTQSRPGPGLRKEIGAEITPREAELTPADFKVRVGAVRGRVIVNAVVDGPDVETRTETILAPLVGTIPVGPDSPDMQVAATAVFPPGRIRVRGAGIDPSNPGLLGALGQSIRTPGSSEGPDLAALTAEGLLDVDGEIAVASEASPASPTFRLFLRENSLQTSRNFRLDRLRGVLELRGDKVLLGRGIRASLAGTTLDLGELRFSQTREGFELSVALQQVEGFPLDRDHLRGFVDEATLKALLEQLGWQGRIDLKSGNVKITGPSRGDPRLEFVGEINASGMQIQLGLPFSIQSASVKIERLVYEQGRVRGMFRIQDLYGLLAGRRLDKAEMLVTYVEPRLSIESIAGKLEGGDIRPLGKDAERGGTAFSIDLEEPFPFQLSLDLREVELAGLFGDLFAANFATRGKLDCQLRLTGDTRRVLGIQGSGSVQVVDSRLWSVPVFRELFSQLGIDDKLTFDQMAANLRIKDGVISTDDISIHSPILILVGRGSIDFDGTVEEDLQVRYDLIDRLGPLTRILYAIQKQLLAVAIRGDLGRPIVIIRNFFTKVSADNDRYRSLPMPGLSPLPPRF